MQIINKSVVLAGCMAFILMAGSSCKKILNERPYNSFSNETAFTTPARAEAAINGVYDAAQSGFYAGGQVRGYPFGAANIQQGDMRGEDMLNQALFYQVTYEAAYNPTTANQEFMFNTLYSLINKANLALEGVSEAGGKGILSSDLTKQYQGETRFLRAMAHHELLIHFARPFSDGAGAKTGIVYREAGIDSDAEVETSKSQRRGTVADNYAKVLADLDFAETNLPVYAKDHTGADQRTFRASKVAAIALKMRVKLHMQDWAGVIAEGNKLVPTSAPFVSPVGGWRLTANPGDPFVLPGTSAENIFSIRNAATDNPGNNGALALMLGNTAIGGRALVRISPIIYNLPEWLCDDKRRSLLSTVGTGSGINYVTTKYKDAATATDPAPQIRYAEVLLTLAEAEARNASGVSVRGLELLNAVRNRALANPAVQQYSVFATKNDLIRAILIERRIEFLAEGKRWGDIHRLAVDPVFSTGGIPAKIGTGIATTSMYQCGAGSAPYASALQVQAFPYSDYRFLWPIPLSERQQNQNYEQNPGY